MKALTCGIPLTFKSYFCDAAHCLKLQIDCVLLVLKYICLTDY